MIIGSLAIGIISAIVAATLSLITGYGILAACGFYILGGLIGMIGTASLGVFAPRALSRIMAQSDHPSDGLAEKA